MIHKIQGGSILYNKPMLTAEHHEMLSALWTARKMTYDGDPKGNLILSGVLKGRPKITKAKDDVFYIVSDDYLVVDTDATKILLEKGTVFRYNSGVDQMHIIQGGLAFYRNVGKSTIFYQPLVDKVFSIVSYEGGFVKL